MQTGRRESNTHETGEFFMSLIGKIVEDDNGDIRLQCTNKSNEQYLWKPENFFFDTLRRMAKLEKAGIFVNIHLHALDDKETCEVGRFLTGTKRKFLRHKDKS